MSAHHQLLDTTKKPAEAVPRENLDDPKFKDRVETWRDYLADAGDGPKLKLERHSARFDIRGICVISGREFNFPIPFKKDIETAYGVSPGCELQRIDFRPKPSGEQFRAQYLVNNLPDEKRKDSFATDDKTRVTIIVTYDAESNTKQNVCLNQDQFGYSNKESPRMIPLFIRERD
jgi:hypothetical protein